MIVKTDRSFVKDIDKISDRALGNKVADLIEKMQESDDIQQLTGIKKLVGYINFYRIRIGFYRIGFRVENGVIILERFLHRKDIYRYFPKK